MIDKSLKLYFYLSSYIGIIRSIGSSKDGKEKVNKIRCFTFSLTVLETVNKVDAIYVLERIYKFLEGRLN